jgi:predicted GTPase
MRIPANMNSPAPHNAVSPETSSPTASAPADQKQAKDTGKKAEPPLNVLILGETANGKSTLIRQLGVYAGNRNPDVKIGYG